MSELQELLCLAGKIMFEKRLTDLAGGNISVRDGEFVYMSPRFAGQRRQWHLCPDDLVTGRWEDDEIGQNPLFSREGWSHLYIYRHFPDVTAVIHAHPFHVLPFAAACRPIEPVLEGTQKFGTVELTEPAPAHSRQLADHVIASLAGKEERMRKQAAAVLVPYHGIIVAGKDLPATLDALERIDTNAYCILARKLMD